MQKKNYVQEILDIIHSGLPQAELAEKLAAGKASAEELKAAASEISDQFTYGSNMRGSAEYRHHLGRVLLRRCMEEIQKKEEQ